METNEISDVGWWVKTDLPGMPILAMGGMPLNERDILIRDGGGKLILFDKPDLGNVCHAAAVGKALAYHLHRKVRVVRFMNAINRAAYGPSSRTVPSGAAFNIDASNPLTITERIQSRMISDLFERYVFVAPSAASYRLSSIFHEYRHDNPDDAWGLPAYVGSDEKAFQLAQVAERILGTEAEIVREPDGGFCVVIPHTDRIVGDDAMLRLSLAIDLLNHFNISLDGEAGMIDVEEDEQKMFDRSLSGATTYDVQKRVEVKLDEILSRLERPEAAKGVGNADTPVREKRLAKPADAAPKPGKSAASKRSA
jgi:hypothetical protein